MHFIYISIYRKLSFYVFPMLLVHQELFHMCTVEISMHTHDKVPTNKTSVFLMHYQNCPFINKNKFLFYRCDKESDGSVTLHYYTIRPGLYPIVLGKPVKPRDIFNQTLFTYATSQFSKIQIVSCFSII